MARKDFRMEELVEVLHQWHSGCSISQIKRSVWIDAIIEVFQHKVFRMLLKEGLITEDRVKMILSWRHFSLRSMQALPGFHVHNEGRVVANDMEGRERLARYLIRPPVSLERLTYDRKNQQVYYQGKAETHTYKHLLLLHQKDNRRGLSTKRVKSLPNA